MLDSNLPTYYFRASTDKDHRYDFSLHFTQFGSEPEPRYTLRHPDPSSQQAKGCYAAALFDAFVSDVLFGEVLLKPEWTKSILPGDDIYQNGGAPLPPAPVVPQEFTIQLYNPEQQILVVEKPATWGGSPTYHFSMPQLTFRVPSASTLDRSTNDPAADATTPQVMFVWRREGKLSKDLTCSLTGKSTSTQKKRRGGKEPDIPIALLSGYRDLTLYEPNFHRVEMEDYKGLEVVLLLTAAVIRDVYSGQRKDCFNVGEAARKNSAGILNRKKSGQMLTENHAAPVQHLKHTKYTPQNLQSNGVPAKLKLRRQSFPPPASASASDPRPVPDPRAQWEIDRETARLRQELEAEKRQSEARRREEQRRAEAEVKRLRKMVAEEEKQNRRQQAEVDKETQRLRRLYGHQSTLLAGSAAARPSTVPPPAPPRHSSNHAPGFIQHHQSPVRPHDSYSPHVQSSSPPTFGRPHLPPPQPRPDVQTSPFLRPGHGGQATTSVSSFFGGGGGRGPVPKLKKSIFGLRGFGEPTAGPSALARKRSSMF